MASDTPNDADENPSAGQYRDPKVILDEMLESIRLIQSYMDNISYEAFAAQQLSFRMLWYCALLFWVRLRVIFVKKTKLNGTIFPGVSLPICVIA